MKIATLSSSALCLAVLFTACGTANSARAVSVANYNPQASIERTTYLTDEMSASHPVAKYAVISGFTGTRSEITIASDGTVIQDLDVRGEKKQRTLTTLEADVMQGLLANIEAIQNSALVLENPSSRICFDAPTLLYTVVKADGTSINISKTMNCRKSVLVTRTDADKQVINTFASLIEMSYQPW